MWNYTKNVMEHFLNPRNVGEIEDADAVAEVGNITCGDALKLFLKLDSEGRIADAKFRTFGCASAIASSSALTELIKGKTLEEAAKITNKDIVALLGTLPEEKMHCSVMGMEALQAAIADYKKRHGEEYVPVESEDDHEGRIVCKCFGVTDAKIRKVALANNLHTVAQVTDYTKAGGACGRCLDEIQQILDELWNEHKEKEQEPQAAAPFDALSKVKKILNVNSVLESEVAPALRNDGGDVELVDVEGNVVKVKLTGICAGCPHATATVHSLIEAKLREALSQSIVVEQVN
ncbi:MAG: Fe-S cluster assembly protein NifU [Victivallales bacterium]|nr:Fe-S cluster assembly protein NifU [Victivallales bacterium]